MPISAEMITHLASPITMLCRAIKITEIKLDGTEDVVLRFVNHTRNLVIDEETYIALPLPPTQFQQTEGLDPDNTQITAIFHSAFTAINLRARKWAGARVEYMVVNYLDTTMGPAVRKVGYFGKTRIKRFLATPEIRSLSQLLEQPIGDVYSEECRNILGDENCTVDLDGTTATGYLIRSNATVIGVTDKQRFAVSYSSLLSGAASQGLLAEYYNGTNFDSFKYIRIDANVNFDFGLGSPAPGVNTSHYSIRWRGQITPLYSETYTFEIYHDDGVKLWVNNVLVIDEWNSASTHTGTIALTANTPVDIKIEFHNDVSPGGCILKWQSASQALEVVPTSKLSPLAVAAPDGYWSVGNAEWLTGNNQYQQIKVLKNVGNSITLYLPTNRSIQIGDTLRLTAGCDGKRATCRDKYANVVNIDAEPDLPGTSRLFRFPG